MPREQRPKLVPMKTVRIEAETIFEAISQLRTSFEGEMFRSPLDTRPPPQIQIGSLLLAIVQMMDELAKVVQPTKEAPPLPSDPPPDAEKVPT
jgi:hypothetical protein